MNRAIVCSAFVLGVLSAAGCTSASTAITSNTGANRSAIETPNNNSPASNVSNSNIVAVQNGFYTSAARGGIAEVEMSKLAQTRSTNGEVKRFAQMVAADHTTASSGLKALAATKNVTLPTEPSPSHIAVIDELKGLSGPDFDRTYVDEMVADHEADVQLFEEQAQDETDPEAKAFATKTLPTLQKHLEMIKGIQSRLQ